MGISSVHIKDFAKQFDWSENYLRNKSQKTHEKYDYRRVFPVSTSVITSENGTRKFRLINVNTATKNRQFHLNFLSSSAVIFPLDMCD